MLLQRFRDELSLRKFQNTDEFKAFASGSKLVCDGPIGLYMTNERNGKLGQPVHPFGPGGEGGRDDAIYSSPTNLQGSAM